MEPHLITNIKYKDIFKRNITISQCVKELMIFAYKLYLELLQEPQKIIIICGGQSPAYYCLAMMNLKIYNPNKVNIVILPHSLFGENITNVYHLHNQYADRIKEKNIKVNDNIVILDGVHSGAGINSLTRSLRHCFDNEQNLKIRKYAINHNIGISSIPVDREYELKYEPIFSDSFPRIVVSYRPIDFNSSKKFINNFLIGEKNEIAHMIIDIAKNYPENNLIENEWYKLNNPVDLITDLSLSDVLKYKSFVKTIYKKLFIIKVTKNYINVKAVIEYLEH